MVWFCCVFILLMMATDTLVKTLLTGIQKSANLLFVTLPSNALSTLKKMDSKDITPEQQTTKDRSFVIRCLALSLIFIVIIFGYSVVKQTQPLFSEAPTDKAILAVLSLILGQAIQIVANYLNSSKPLTPPIPPASCTPVVTPVASTNITPATSATVAPSATPKPVSTKPPKLDDED